MASLSNAMPRPGVALGRYPERKVERPGKLDALLNRWTARIATRWRTSEKHLGTIITQIHEMGESLVAMPDEVLAMTVNGLRLRLARDGWNEDLASQAFAVVREMSARTLGMRHYDSQLLGGWVLFNGKVAEMQTGEGKTLSATLPASTAAMAGVPVHVITSNDYLAARDAQLMRPLYEALGLSVGVITEEMDFDARRSAYACDITYCTNKQVTFDYLRDRVARGRATGKLHLDLERIYDDPSKCSKLMLRGLCYAIVDEADSVLVDEARTPLVLSRTVEGDSTSDALYREALHLACQLSAEEDFRVLARERNVPLTDVGRARLDKLVAPLGLQWKSVRRREELIQQALMALHMFIRDRDYVVRDGKVQIVDGNTGRTMADRSWERGLHQMVEAKEDCELSGHKETLARMSYQRFFRRYLRLSGMTGTGKEVEGELSEVYGLSMVQIPTHRPSRRTAWPDRIYAKLDDKNAAVVASARQQAADGRPVLVGTRSVGTSEQLGQLFNEMGLDAQILNARQDAEEADIIERAGEAGRITVATNMAGRGTDISLGPGVEEGGGLHVIVAERNEAARIDRQLIGRCARQGDPGSYQMFASLEDEIPIHFYPSVVRHVISLFAHHADGRLPTWLGKVVMRIAQSSLERRHKRLRHTLDREDERLNDVLAFTGETE